MEFRRVLFRSKKCYFGLREKHTAESLESGGRAVNSGSAKNERYAVAATPILRLLGDFAVEPADLFPTGRKARALLARLALADAPLARDRLSALLWSRRPDTQAHASLRQCLVELKCWTRASPPLLHADRETLAIEHTRVATDISLLQAPCAADAVAVVLHRLPAHDIRLDRKSTRM